MKLSKQRKVYIAVLAVAGAALAFDRFSGGGMPGPQQAEASSLLVSPSERSSSPGAVSNDSGGKTSGGVDGTHQVISVAQQLAAWRAGRPDSAFAGAPRDAFAYPVALERAVVPVVATPASVRDGTATGSGARIPAFAAPALRLTSIINASTGSAGRFEPVAMIDDTPCRVGAVVQGWKVASITDRGVTVVDAYGREAKIELPDPLAKNPRAR